MKDVIIGCDPGEKLESYLMIPDPADQSQQDHTLIVKRVEMIFNDINCQVLNFTDITTYKLLKQEEETSRLLQALNASAHHEMLGPLKTNVEFSNRLVNLLRDKEHKKMCQTINISSKMILLHANDLLDHSILQHGNFVPAYSPGSISTAILDIVEMIRHTVERKKLTIRCQLSEIKQFFIISFDKRRFQQVLLNLLSNAVKFQEKGVIKVTATIRTRNLDGKLFIILAVKDKGIGMTKSEAAQVFNPFNRTRDQTSQRMNSHSNGIGLSICKQICENLNGNIMVSSVQKKGSTFAFSMQVYTLRNPDAFVNHADIEVEEEKEDADYVESSEDESNLGGFAEQIEKSKSFEWQSAKPLATFGEEQTPREAEVSLSEMTKMLFF